MCVISVIDSLDAIPSHDSIDKMAHENPHGNSISYFDQVTKSIIYHKAIKLKKLKKIQKECIKRGNLSIVQHYRIASVGSSENKLLNHGFKIENGSINDLHGSTNSDLLFHNGTIELKELLQISKSIMINNPHAIFPKGELSDTLVMAFILNFVDYSFLNHYIDSNRFVIMNGKTGEITTYGEFANVHDSMNDNELVTSNDYFTNTYSMNSGYGAFDRVINAAHKSKKRVSKDYQKEYDRIYENNKMNLDSPRDVQDYHDTLNCPIEELEEHILNEIDWRIENSLEDMDFKGY